MDPNPVNISNTINTSRLAKENCHIPRPQPLLFRRTDKLSTCFVVRLQRAPIPLTQQGASKLDHPKNPLTAAFANLQPQIVDKVRRG